MNDTARIFHIVRETSLGDTVTTRIVVEGGRIVSEDVTLSGPPELVTYRPQSQGRTWRT